MIEIKKLTELTFEQQKSFGEINYTSQDKFEVKREIAEDEITFKLNLVKTGRFYVNILQNNISKNNEYSKLIEQGNSFGAYENDIIKGFIISDKRRWNNSLWIEQIMVSKEHRNKGIGASLLKRLEDHAVDNKIRMIELETQNTNIPAINFYRKNSYEFSGLNINLYDPAEVGDETAIYMSKIFIY